jgi:hypothetical protein
MNHHDESDDVASCITHVQWIISVESKMANRRYLERTNCSYIEEQNDQRTEELCSKVKLLKYIAIQIREETKSQNADFTVRIE